MLAEDEVAQEVLNNATRLLHSSTQAASSSSSSSSSSNVSVLAAVSPAQVLHLLSAYQSRCVLLLQGQGQLQHSLSEVRRQLRQTQSQLQQATNSQSEAEDRVEKAGAQLRTALQQGKLYDGEVRSLRSLLDTFDAEFRIGKPDSGKIFALKDELIADLRKELDISRREALSYAARVKELEACEEKLRESVEKLQAEQSQQSLVIEALTKSESALTEALAEASAALEEQKSTMDQNKMEADADALTALRQEMEQARNDLLYLQYFTGLDYVPQNTKVRLRRVELTTP